MTAEAGDAAAQDLRARARAGDARRPRFLAFARRYARRRIAHGLDGVWVAGLAEARAAVAGRPVIFAANHVSWWDVLLLVVLDEALGGLGWAMMDSQHLRALPFFGWIGALPLDRTDHERSHRCLHRCVELLDRPGRSLWIFPQGRQRPAHLRPLDLKHGLQTMYDHNPVDVIAVSFNYVFLERDRPAAVVRFSDPFRAVAPAAVLHEVESTLLDGLAEIDRAAIAATDGRRARTHRHDPLPGFAALVAPVGFATQDGLAGRALQALSRRRGTFSRRGRGA